MAESHPSEPRLLCLRLGEVTYPLDADKVVIGRSRSCDIRLREDTVSRLQAAFVWREGNLVIEDLGSSNGTYLNGLRVVEPQTVVTGDVVRFGELRGTVDRSDVPNAGHSSGARAVTNGARAEELFSGDSAGLGWRLLAATADTVIFALGLAVVWAPQWLALLVERHFLAPDTLPPSLETKAMLKGACLVLSLVFGFLYFVHGWARRGGSPGMKLFRLRLLDWRHRAPIGYGRAFLRLAASLVTILTLGLGYFVVPFRRDRKALHDVLAGTIVARRAPRLGQPTPPA
ncbi:MAG: RDD family protein [Thermoanaerobaculaceae bacterium]